MEQVPAEHRASLKGRTYLLSALTLSLAVLDFFLLLHVMQGGGPVAVALGLTLLVAVLALVTAFLGFSDIAEARGSRGVAN